MTNAKCLTLTYLTRASYASLNGSDKEIIKLQRKELYGLMYNLCI